MFLLVCKNQCGPGYKSPLDAYNNSKQETILYTVCIQPNPETKNKPDYLATIDVDPCSATYSQVTINFYFLILVPTINIMSNQNLFVYHR